MWRDWVNGILGILIVILAFLGLPSNIKAVLMIVIGLIVALLSFWKGASAKVQKEIYDSNDVQKPLFENEKIV